MSLTSRRRGNVGDRQHDNAPIHARAVILSLDGGGMRGVVLLELLHALESKLRERAGRKTTNLISLFDLVAGTSAGGILALGCAHRHLSLQQCSTVFSQLAEAAFGERQA